MSHHYQIVTDERENTALSPAARKSVFVLERLLEVENAFRDPTTGEASNKRRRGDNGPENALSPGTLQQDELLRSTIRNILVSPGACSARSHGPTLPHSTAVYAISAMELNGLALTHRNEQHSPSRSAACLRRY